MFLNNNNNDESSSSNTKNDKFHEVYLILEINILKKDTHVCKNDRETLPRHLNRA